MEMHTRFDVIVASLFKLNQTAFRTPCVTSGAGCGWRCGWRCGRCVFGVALSPTPPGRLLPDQLTVFIPPHFSALHAFTGDAIKTNSFPALSQSPLAGCVCVWGRGIGGGGGAAVGVNNPIHKKLLM